MSHQLDFIKSEHIEAAIQRINNNGVPKNHEWSEYWINYNGKLYQFKYVVQIASILAKKPLKTTDFRSSKSSRNYISNLGFQIVFRSLSENANPIKYWIGATYYGPPDNQVDKIKDFIRDNFWRTDHDLDEGEGAKLFKELQKVQINDRLALRYLDKKNNKVEIIAIGTIIGIDNITDGRLEVVWDNKPKLYYGDRPTGLGSGNWWKTFFQLKKRENIEQIFFETIIEKRVARLAWNDNGWIMPSGEYGKSEHKDSHEAIYGYGHEEWLFDTSKTINGYHYGFLEPIRKQQDAFIGNVYNVWLYSINSNTKQRYWIGNIDGLHVIGKEESEKIKRIYINKGWLEEMESQIKDLGFGSGFSNWEQLDLFNVKYKVDNLKINDPYYLLPKDHKINDLSRYAFVHYNSDIASSLTPQSFDFDFISIENNHIDKTGIQSSYDRKPKTIEVFHFHKIISNSLLTILVNKFGANNVTPNHPTGNNTTEIDIVVRDKNRLIFYEIKTYNNLRASIREAFGQLLEYCFYPDQVKAKELIIVTQLPPDIDAISYFKHIRKTFNIPIYYQYLDLKTNILSDKY